jgi:hypothetical protein
MYYFHLIKDLIFKYMTKRPSLVWICLFVLVITSSCEKYNQIDNTGIVRTPYVMYIGGILGSLHQTNDVNYYKPLHPFDDATIRQVITADSNILYLKGNCYVSDDDGRAFNVTNTNARPYYETLFKKYFIPHQMLYDESQRLVYLCVNGGLDQSSDLGKTFAGSTLGSSPTSIIELDNDDIFAIQDDATIHVRSGGVGAWNQVAPGASTLAAGTNYFLSSLGNTLIATDYEGELGCFYSTNGGADWTKYGGVSGNGKNILFVNAVENNQGGQDVFLGRDSLGLFKLNQGSGSFEASSTGIPWFAKVHYVESKKIVFRTGVERYFYFCATDVGLYMSEQESAGSDWRLVRPGEYSTLQ